MRQHFASQPTFQIVPIERVILPAHSRDELPPILAGLQWLWGNPALRAEIFQLLEDKLLAGKKATGRPGMDLWQMLVLGVVRLGLSADWDRMEHLANDDLLLRQMLGVQTETWAASPQVFHHQTLRDNVALLDHELLQQINARITAAGREVFATKVGAPLAPLAVKVDTYVLETDVHFPTDLNLLWDAGRKCLDLIAKMVVKHLDLVQRRLLQEETIPACEKVFSLFEPHTEWIQKGKQRPNVELGHRLLIATDQHQLIQDYAVVVGQTDVDQSVPVADRLLGRYGAGSLASLSFDKGFTRAEDRELLSLFVPLVVMPKRGKKNAAETERESGKKFVALRKAHSAVESEINSLEHHGLNRCLDVGLPAYLRYVGYGVMSYNLHVIGRELLARQRARAETTRLAA